MTSPTNNTFAADCYDMNSIEELETALANGPDLTDMEAMIEWNLTADQWMAQIELALIALRQAS